MDHQLKSIDSYALDWVRASKKEKVTLIQRSPRNLMDIDKDIQVKIKVESVEEENKVKISEDDMSLLQKRRILLKISGEALMGNKKQGFDPCAIARIARDIKEVHDLGIDVCLVVGAGNIFRGIEGEKQNIDRVTSDYIGMLATVMNSLVMQNAIEREGLQARVMSAIPMQSVCETYVNRRALRHLERSRVVIFAAGSGNPYFTTDTGAILRASEMNCEVLMKGTKVQGVYSEDPKKSPHAKHYTGISYLQMLSKNLKVMDAAAIALARENSIPIIVFSINENRGLVDAIHEKGKFTIISNKETIL